MNSAQISWLSDFNGFNWSSADNQGMEVNEVQKLKPLQSGPSEREQLKGKCCKQNSEASSVFQSSSFSQH